MATLPASELEVFLEDKRPQSTDIRMSCLSKVSRGYGLDEPFHGFVDFT